MSVLLLQQSALRLVPHAAPGRAKPPVRLTPGRGGLRYTEIGPGKRRWDLFGASAVFQTAALLVLAWVPLLYVQPPPALQHKLTILTHPLTEYEPPKRQPSVSRPRETQIAQPVERPVKRPPMETRLSVPQPRRREVKPVEAPQVAALPRPVEEMDLGRKRAEAPRAPVMTGILQSPGTSEQPTLDGKRVSEVQTGGFGDPNGVPAKGRTDKTPNINRVGSFGLPPGYGHGNGTGGTQGARGVVASAGFGNGISQGDPGRRGSAGGGVQATGFGDAAPSSEAGARSAAAPRPATVERTPVEILHKPNPRYTDRARELRIEGNVKLRVVFAAGGQLRVLGVLQGLGHGLDEAAVAAAQQIRFRPARENGRPVDEPAIVTIEFKLAF